MMTAPALAKPRAVYDPDALPDGLEVFADEAAFEAFVQVGIDSADRGELIPHEQVVAEMKALLANLRAR